jgi:hypothetical protein
MLDLPQGFDAHDLVVLAQDHEFYLDVGFCLVFFQYFIPMFVPYWFSGNIN